VKFELSDMLEAGKENPPPLRYSVEDAVTAGRKRQRKRAVWTGAGSAAVVVAVAAAIAVPQIVTDKRPAAPGPAAAAATSKAPKPFAYPADNFTGTIAGFKSGDLTISDTVHVTPGYQVAVVVAPGRGTDTIDAQGKTHHSVNDVGTVVVYRKGVYNPKQIKKAKQVTVAGRAAYFQKSLPGQQPDRLKGKLPPHTFDTQAILAWQYGDDAWAVVTTDARADVSQSELAAIASKVTSGSPQAVKVDFKLSYVPGGYELAAAGATGNELLSPLTGQSYVRLLKGDFPYRGLTAPLQDPYVVKDQQLPVLQLSVYPRWYGKYKVGTTPSCVSQSLCYRTTDDGKYELELSGGGFLPDAELIKMLKSVTFADPADKGSWFKATDAVS